MSNALLRRVMFVGLLIAVSAPAHAVAEPTTLRLYTLDCGTLTLQSLALFADGDEYADTPGTLAVPCFLIRHPKGDLLWDAGLGDEFAQRPEGVLVAEGITARVPVTLKAQLRQLDMVPADVEFVAFSHLHFDHTGNAALFEQATYLFNRRELAWALERPTPFGVNADHLRVAANAETAMIDLDHDVFGDGSVRILKAPGHTPGHQVLMLRLPNTGVVVLSGDLYHTRDNYRQSRVPLVNHSRGETLASFDRVGRLLRNHGARLIVQHAPEDFAALPRVPDYLD